MSLRTTPSPSEHPSRTAPGDELDTNVDVIAEAPQDHRSAKRQVCISKAVDAASNAPAGPERNSQAADLAKKVN
jgi:hypothetical protein